MCVQGVATSPSIVRECMGLMVSILSLTLPIVTCVHSVTMLKYSLVDASIFRTDVTVHVCVWTSLNYMIKGLMID